MSFKWLSVIFFVILTDYTSTHILTDTNRFRRAALHPGTISKQKCAEYSQYKPLRSASTIVGGVDVTNLAQFPHMALLGFDLENKIEWACGGSIISEKFVLTAAHCLSSGFDPVSRVQVGFLDKQNRNEFGSLQEFKVINTFKPVDHTQAQSYNDIALLELDRPVKFSNMTYPACLHTQHKIKFPHATAVGWGKKDHEDETASDTLQRVKLLLTRKDECQPFYSSQRKLPRGVDYTIQLCAGQFMKDTCQGDSGGPLQINDGRGMANIIGIVSTGINCGQVPGIYTRVSHYVPWIESKVWA